MLLQGGSYLQSALQMPAAMANILQGVIIFFVLGADFFVRYKLVWVKKESKKSNDSTDEAKDNSTVQTKTPEVQ
jgi:simple sugar transport system permease protein